MHQLLLNQLQQHLDRGPVPAAEWQPLLDDLDRRNRQADSNQRLLRGVIDGIPELISIKSAAGVYVGCNKAFERHVGVSEAQLLGKTDLDIFEAAVANAVQANDEEARYATAGEQHCSEAWGADAQGSPQCIETLRTPYFDADGELLGLVAVGRDVTERKLSSQTNQRDANFDTLTQLPNRRYFTERLSHELKLAQRAKVPLALLSIGLERFRGVSETMGSAAADALLAQLARRVLDVVRETDMAARLGSEEFAVVIPGLREVPDIERIAQNIIRRLAEPCMVGGGAVQISASVGIALSLAGQEEPAALIHNANQAMFFAKSSGRDRFCHFTFALQEAAIRRGRLKRDLRRAVDVRQFEVYYQPIVDLRTGQIARAEALLRWNHDGRGQIMPIEFIPLAEDNGAIVDIGDWVFREVAQQVKQLRQAGNPDFCVSINTSSTQLRSSNTTPADWLAVLAPLGLSSDSIMLELTESVLLKASEYAGPQLKAFRAAGFQMAIDNFSMTDASLESLRRFDIDHLKIGYALVSALVLDASDKALCQAIIAKAHKLGLKVVAEGVETEGQRALLAEAGCDYAQGFLFSRPLPIAALTRLLRERA
jgi:diguanylate cyclase (GGDEF)-like protein/PAS domain S-box-containing protein